MSLKHGKAAPKPWSPNMGVTVAQLIEEAAKALAPQHPTGFTEADIRKYLEEFFPRSDGRPWDSNLVIAGDYALWADTGEPANESTASDNKPRILQKISQRDEHPNLFLPLGADKAKRNPAWQRDELILALDLYFKYPPNSISKNHPAVIELSEILNRLPIHEDRPDQERFRNPNGVYMKLCNFLRFDPDYKGKGLTAGGALEEVIWNEFAGDCERLTAIGDGIRSGLAVETVSNPGSEGDEAEFPEGRVMYRVHRSRERSHELVRKAKDNALKKHGKLTCEACGFDFQAVYGKVGKDFIECHHNRPISEADGGQKSRVADMSLLCSNCHRMIHRRRPWLSVEELSRIIRT